MLSSRLSYSLFALLVGLSMPVDGFAQADDTGGEKERMLLAVLESDAPKAEKAIACKKLAIDGSGAAVPELAKLLSDPHLSSWARIALEAIPDAVADDALRTAASSLEGILLVGVINSIGVRRDQRSVDTLAGKLTAIDGDVARAAAVALGRIGNANCCETLQAALQSSPKSIRSAVAEGCVLCAEQLLARGESTKAIEIYDQVRGADVPMQRVVEATRGAILARNQEGIPLLLETLESPQKKLFQLALGTIREFPGAKIDSALANQIQQAPPERAALLIQAMADRAETVVLEAIARAAEGGDIRVRTSAVDALRRVGDHSCVPILLKISTEEKGTLAESARTSLVKLSGERVDDEIVARLATAKGQMQATLLELIGQRRIDEFEKVQSAIDSPSPAVRQAAMTALGQIAPIDKLPVLVSYVVESRRGDDAETAGQALRTASIRMPDREEVASILTDALSRSPADSKTALLEILSEVGGPQALATLADAAGDNDPQMQDAASRLLGKWNSLDAAPVLLDLARTAPVEKYRIRSLRGYIGLARKFSMPEAQRAEMCRRALQASQRLAEQKLVLDVLKLRPSADGLKLVASAREIRGLEREASQTALAIAHKLNASDREIRELLENIDLERVELEIVKAEYGSGAAQREVTQLVRKQASDLPLISIPGSNYNAHFGDPAPGIRKQLRIQYKINGKSGEATFAENAPILLPFPE